jgi:prepilin-type N-terminal cleavage/methylation domain-containing protein
MRRFAEHRFGVPPSGGKVLVLAKHRRSFVTTRRKDMLPAKAGTPHNRAVGGFSLVEVMCAILILGIALIGLTQGITSALVSSKESELQSTAAMFAAGKIEMVRADGYLTDGEKEGDCGDDLPLYQWKQSISSTGVNGLHEVVIKVEKAKTGDLIYELRTLLFDATDSAFEDANQKKDATKDKDKGKGKKKRRGQDEG